MSEFLFQYAIDDIIANYNGNVSSNFNLSDRETLIKFGRNENIGNSGLSTIMALNGAETNETYISDNLIDTVSSTSTSDTTSMIVEGHTIDGNGDFTYVSQEVTLLGQNKATLTTPLARCNRMYNNGSVDFVGRIFAYQDTAITLGEPDNDTLIHCIISAGYNESQKCATTVSSTQWWIVSNAYSDLLEKTSLLASVVMEVRLKGKVFMQVFEMSTNTESRAEHEFNPWLIIPPNSDVRMRAVASATNTEVSAGIQGFLLRSK